MSDTQEQIDSARAYIKRACDVFDKKLGAIEVAICPTVIPSEFSGALLDASKCQERNIALRYPPACFHGTDAASWIETSSTNVEPVSTWQVMFDHWYYNSDKDYEGWNLDLMSITPNGSIPYYSAYGIEGLTDAWMGSGDTKYLDIAIQYVKNTIGVAKPSSELLATCGPTSNAWGDEYEGWLGFNSTELGQFFAVGEEVQSEAQWARSVLRMLYYMSIVPSVSNDSDYQAIYVECLEWVEVNVVEKWYNRIAGAQQPGHWIFNLGNAIDYYARWAEIGLFLGMIGTTAARVSLGQSIYDQTNGPTGYTHSGGFRSIRNQMLSHEDDANAWWWDRIWHNFDNTTLGDDTPHATLMFAFAVEAIAWGGNTWTLTDLEKLRNTWRLMCDEENNTVAGHVNSNVFGRQFIADGMIQLGWKYGPNDSDAKEILISLQKKQIGGNIIRSQHYGRLMFAAATHEYVAGSGQPFDETVSSWLAAMNTTA